MKSKRLSLNEAFQLLNMLLESNEKRVVLFNTDSISSFDIIKEFAKQIKISNKPIRIRDDEKSGHLESYHKLLLDCYLSYNKEGLVLDSLYNEMHLYDKYNTSIVFLAEGIHVINGLPPYIEVFDCYNPDALTVGDFVDKLNEISDNVAIAYCQEDYSDIVGFVSPNIICYNNQFVTIDCLIIPFYVSSIIQSLSTFDSQLPMCFKTQKGYYDFAYEINEYEKDFQDGRISYIAVECTNPLKYIQDL